MKDIETLESIELLKLLLPKIKKEKKKKSRRKTDRAPVISEYRDQKNRETIYKTKPWEYCKGKKTPEGKKKSAMNAYKHGRYSKAMKEIEKIERELKKRLKENA